MNRIHSEPVEWIPSNVAGNAPGMIVANKGFALLGFKGIQTNNIIIIFLPFSYPVYEGSGPLIYFYEEFVQNIIFFKNLSMTIYFQLCFRRGKRGFLWKNLCFLSKFYENWWFTDWSDPTNTPRLCASSNSCFRHYTEHFMGSTKQTLTKCLRNRAQI